MLNPNHREKSSPEYEVSEPEVEEAHDEKPQARQKTARRKRAPQWATQPEQNQDVVQRAPDPQMQQQRHIDPESSEARREATMKSRIKDREHSEANDSSLKIKIELDLEAEVNLYARVKGDVTIGLL